MYIETTNKTVAQIVKELSKPEYANYTFECTRGNGIIFTPSWEIGRQVKDTISANYEELYIVGETKTRWKISDGRTVSKTTHYDSNDCSSGKLFYTLDNKLDTAALNAYMEAMNEAKKQIENTIDEDGYGIGVKVRRHLSEKWGYERKYDEAGTTATIIDETQTFWKLDNGSMISKRTHEERGAKGFYNVSWDVETEDTKKAYEKEEMNRCKPCESCHKPFNHMKNRDSHNFPRYDHGVYWGEMVTYYSVCPYCGSHNDSETSPAHNC